MAFPVYRQVESNTLQLRPSQTKIVRPFPDYIPTNSDSQAAIDAINALVFWTDAPPWASSIPDNSITLSKLATVTPATVLMGNSASGIQAISFAGDVTVTSTGVTAIGANKVTNAMIAGSIAASKITGTAITAADTGTVTNTMLAGSIAASKITGTAITAADTGTVTNTMLAGSIATTKLVASTISGITLGGTLGTLTFNNAGGGGASGTTYTGATGATISYNTIGAAATNQTMHIGTTAVAINRGSATQTLTGVSIDGTAGSISGFNNPTTSATGSTIAYRDSNGDLTARYFFASYFNQSLGNSENPTIGQIWTQNTTDDYVRKSTPTHFVSQLGLLTTSNYTSTTDSRYVRRDTTGQFLKPYYEYPSNLTSESPSTLASQMGGGGIRVDFMDPSYTGTGGWNHVITFSGYSFYNMYQLGAHYDGGTGTELYVRSEANHTGSSWTSWKRLLHTSNFNLYVPSRTGQGASGSWGISVSGNAGTATTLQTSRTIWGQSFNGGSNISGNLTGVGNIVLSGAGGILTPGGTDWILYWDNVSRVGLGTSSLQSGYTWTFGQSVYVNGSMYANGDINAVSKSFDIPHPHRPQSRLRYASVESPRLDLIHRGTATVCDGWCRIDLDASAGLTTGTVASLMRDMQAIVTKTAPTRGNLWAYVEGTTLVIQSDEPHETHQVSWLVIGERCDRTIQTSRVTDSTGRLIVEYPENA